MAWWIVAALAVALVVMVMLYRTSHRENRGLMFYALLLLLSDEVLEKHRSDLAEFVRSIDAEGASDLLMRVVAATNKAAIGQADINPLGVAGELWKLKTDQPVSAAPLSPQS